MVFPIESFLRQLPVLGDWQHENGRRIGRRARFSFLVITFLLGIQIKFMTQQTEQTATQNNFSVFRVAVSGPHTLHIVQDPGQDDPSVEEAHIASNPSLLAPEPEPAQNGESNPPSSIVQSESQDDHVLEGEDESSKIGGADKNCTPKGEGAPAKSQSEPEIHKDLAAQSTAKSQKCWNKMCCSKEPTRKIKSRVTDRVLMLCRSCAANYNNLKFCEGCQQIYQNDDAGDGFQWVQCESETCARWNHVDCETKRGRYDGHSQYLCAECQRKNRRKRLPVIETLELARVSKEKKPIGVPLSKRAHIFDIRKDNFHYLQPFLSTFSYRLALGEEAILNDLHAIRHKSIHNGDHTKKNMDLANKKKKR